MKIEDFSSTRNEVEAPELPDNFARDVIVKARSVQRHRRIRNRLAASATVMLLAFAMPLANRISSRGANLTASHRAASEVRVKYPQGDDETAALSLAGALSPDAIGDYLMPATTALTQFASAYNDASWDDEAGWMGDSDDSAGG